MISAYLVVERRFQGHVTSQERVQAHYPSSIAETSSQVIAHTPTSVMIDVETLAQDVATGVTYFLKNVHERLII